MVSSSGDVLFPIPLVFSLAPAVISNFTSPGKTPTSEENEVIFNVYTYPWFWLPLLGWLTAEKCLFFKDSSVKPNFIKIPYLFVSGKECFPGALVWGMKEGSSWPKKQIFITNFHFFLAFYWVFSGLRQCCNSLIIALLPLLIFQLLEHLHIQ